MDNETYYIAGPMRGLPFLNFPAFDAARDRLLAAGHTVISPADIDRSHGFEPCEDPEEAFRRASELWALREIIRRDIDAVLRCSRMLMLRGSSRSDGAFAEYAVAKWAGIPVEWEDDHDR